METSRKFTLNPEYTVEKFENEILLYSISDTNGVYLNETAYLVWEMCDKGLSIKEMIALLEKAFPQQTATIRDDVVSAVESLLDNGALIGVDE